MSNSRTSYSLKNAGTSMLFYFLYLILGFVSRKAFLDYLGAEILGLNTTATNILGILNLTELGIANAVGFFLYKPFFTNDRKTICEIVSLQGWLYRKIAYFILALSGIVMLFFPWIFAKSPLSLWYAYSTFTVLVVGAMLSYFFNYKTIVVGAAQKGYKLQFVYQGTNIAKTIIEIIVITYSPWPYIGWITVEFGMTIVQTILLQVLLRREFCWLKTDLSKGKELFKKYTDIWIKTKQLFIHKIGMMVLHQLSPLIMYGFTSLTTVALYGNYIIIVGKIGHLVRSMFDSIGASVGNLVASGDDEKIRDVFWELFDSRLMIVTICLSCLYHLTQPFIVLWLGKEYLFTNAFLILYLAYNSIYMTRSTVDAFLGAYGLFKDVWAPAAEAVLNVSLSIMFGYLWSLNGIILGMMISQIVIISIWKPYFLFTQGFKISAKSYFMPMFARIAIAFFVIGTTYLYFTRLVPIRINDYIDLIINTLHVGLVCSIASFTLFYWLTKGTRAFTKRMIGMVAKKQ